MSYHLEILSETSYQNFLNQLHGDSSFEEIEQWRLEYDKKHPYIDMDTLREQEGWLNVYYEYDE